MVGKCFSFEMELTKEILPPFFVSQISIIYSVYDKMLRFNVTNSNFRNICEGFIITKHKIGAGYDKFFEWRIEEKGLESFLRKRECHRSLL